LRPFRCRYWVSDQTAHPIFHLSRQAFVLRLIVRLSAAGHEVCQVTLVDAKLLAQHKPGDVAALDVAADRRSIHVEYSGGLGDIVDPLAAHFLLRCDPVGLLG
jgi:hypothetical protein